MQNPKIDLSFKGSAAIQLLTVSLNCEQVQISDKINRLVVAGMKHPRLKVEHFCARATTRAIKHMQLRTCIQNRG